MNERAKILIVDDEPFNVDYLEQELEDLNYETITASNGQEALDQVQAHSPDLVLLDIMMPVMDGFKVLAILKASPGTRDIPVIIISAMNDLKSVVKGIRQGAEDYLPKPFEPVLLQARISSSLEKKSLRDQQRKLLHTMATSEVAEELLANGFNLGGKHVSATVMFSDIRSFTTIAEYKDPCETIELLNDYFALVFEPINRHGGIVNQIVGDGLMAVFGAPIQRSDHATQAVLAAIEMIASLEHFNQEQAILGKQQLKIGIGITTGQVVAGITGTFQRATYTCVGDTVNLASRLESHTKVCGYPILIDANTRYSLPAEITTQPLEPVTLKGKTVAIDLFSVNLDR